VVGLDVTGTRGANDACRARRSLSSWSDLRAFKWLDKAAAIRRRIFFDAAMRSDVESDAVAGRRAIVVRKRRRRAR